MIQKLINHWTERPSRVLAESLRIPIRFEVELKRRHYQAPSWFPLVPSSTRSKLGEPPGEGWGEEVGSCKKSEHYYKGVKAFFTVDLPNFLSFLVNFFLSHVSKNTKTGMLLHRHPKPRLLVGSTKSPWISVKFMLETAKTFITSFNQSMDNTGSQNQPK